MLVTIVDKLLIGLLILILCYRFNEKLEKLKGQINLTNAVALNRILAFGKLWELTKPFSPHFDNAHDDAKMWDIRNKLSEWYYDEGNAMYLSFEASNLFLRSMPLLERSVEEGWGDIWNQIKDSFSRLRTQLKVDVRTECHLLKGKITIN